MGRVCNSSVTLARPPLNAFTGVTDATVLLSWLLVKADIRKAGGVSRGVGGPCAPFESPKKHHPLLPRSGSGEAKLAVILAQQEPVNWPLGISILFCRFWYGGQNTGLGLPLFQRMAIARRILWKALQGPVTLSYSGLMRSRVLGKVQGGRRKQGRLLLHGSGNC